MDEREFQYIIYGASGFTGQYVVERLAIFLKEKPTVKWAVAGRNGTKIGEFMADSSKRIGIDLSSIQIIKADSSDESSLAAMAKRGKVVINCVGPYRLYGEPVVRACVQSGTSMVDISGEPAYLEGMQAKYHDEAKKNGCYIVSACGWDSIPCDLGVDYLCRQAKGDVSSIETFVEFLPGPQGYVINSGTYQTLLLGFAHRDNLKDIRRQIMPDRVPTLPPKLMPRNPLFKMTNSYINKWSLIFPGSDRSVVLRSIYHKYHEMQQKPVQIQTYIAVPSFLQSLMICTWALLLAVMTKFKPTLQFLQNNVSLCTGGAFSDKGPTREQAASSRFTYWFFARAWRSKTSRDEMPKGTPDETIVVRCDGPDAGYNATSACVVSAAMSIVEDWDKLPKGGGVYTPAVAFGDTRIMDRLRQCDVKFKVVENSNE